MKEHEAAKNMDWQQVIQNGGPPCFHFEDGRFCGRAQRWSGHDKMHAYVSLADLLKGKKCKHPPEKVWSMDPVAWCQVCGAMRIMRCGHFGRWVHPEQRKEV